MNQEQKNKLHYRPEFGNPLVNLGTMLNYVLAIEEEKLKPIIDEAKRTGIPLSELLPSETDREEVDGDTTVDPEELVPGFDQAAREICYQAGYRLLGKFRDRIILGGITRENLSDFGYFTYFLQDSKIAKGVSIVLVNNDGVWFVENRGEHPIAITSEFDEKYELQPGKSMMINTFDLCEIGGVKFTVIYSQELNENFEEDDGIYFFIKHPLLKFDNAPAGARKVQG